MKNNILVAWVRGAFGNMFEGQNYIFSRDISLTGILSQHPLTSKFPFPVTHLLSITDIPFYLGLQNSALTNRAIFFVTNRLLGDAQYLSGFEKAVSNSDIVHVADAHYFYSYQSAILRKKGKIKRLVSTAWETLPHNNETVKRKKQNKYFVYSQVDQFICYTKKAKEALLLEGVSERKIALINLGVDVTRFSESSVKPSRFTITCAARLIEEKGILDLYAAFKTLCSTRQDVLLTFVGNGPLKPKLMQMITEDHLEKNIEIRSVSYDMMPDVYRQTSLFVLPSQRSKTWEEQLGMVLMEAMASGVPIIATSTGAIPEIIGDSGMLVPEKNPTKLHDAILYMITHPDKQKQFGVRARLRALELFDSRKTARAIGTIYQRLYEDIT